MRYLVTWIRFNGECDGRIMYDYASAYAFSSDLAILGCKDIRIKQLN